MRTHARRSRAATQAAQVAAPANTDSCRRRRPSPATAKRASRHRPPDFNPVPNPRYNADAIELTRAIALSNATQRGPGRLATCISPPSCATCAATGTGRPRPTHPPRRLAPARATSILAATCARTRKRGVARVTHNNHKRGRAWRSKATAPPHEAGIITAETEPCASLAGSYPTT